MTTLHDAPAEELVEAVAVKLDDRLDAPGWARFTKTGVDAELPPEQADFWPRRAASILRKVAIDGPVGVERLTTEYGGATGGTNRYRVAPPRRTDGSGKIVRTILQQLEAEGLVDSRDGDGRYVTGEGRSLLDTTAGEVLENLDRPELERYL
ncbi:30S ribosomal protein S19e [Halobacteriales archaeon SW_7_68_16]|nr:MAG: 30S ribosomal protein S19e [Halobacteriales archaeon SW_7_68_16]